LATISICSRSIAESPSLVHGSLIQVDEVWSFVQKKQARVTAEDSADVGEAYTFTALDAT